MPNGTEANGRGLALWITSAFIGILITAVGAAVAIGQNQGQIETNKTEIEAIRKSDTADRARLRAVEQGNAVVAAELRSITREIDALAKDIEAVSGQIESVLDRLREERQ